MSDADKSALRPANDNPWYCLATLHGEQPVDHSNEELTSKNRLAWNRWIATALNDGERAGLVKNGFPAFELAPFSPEEKSAFCRAYAVRTGRENELPPEPTENYDFTFTHYDRFVSFDSFLFWQHAKFDSATFSHVAEFDSATFSGRASFYQATFSNAYFGSATFSDSANFTLATFSSADFSSATFSGDAYFGSAKFSGDADFSSVKFSGNAVFQRVTFSGPAVFSSATFLSILTIVNAKFAGITEFDKTDF